VSFPKYIAIIGPLHNVKPSLSPAYFQELRAQSQRHLIAFLEAEIALGSTFADAAAYQRDLGQTEHSRHSKEEAGKAVASIQHFIDRIASPEIRSALADRCAQLERTVTAI